MMALRIFLVRHAKAVGKGFKGSDVDSELSEEGIRQAKSLAKYFSDKNISGIYCSDLKRAKLTAEIISGVLVLPLVFEKDLREKKIGDWVKKQENNLIEKWNNYYDEKKREGLAREEIRAPGGENTWDHMKRVRRFLDKLEKKSGNIIVVAHSGTNKVFLGMIDGKDPDDFYSIPQDNCCVNELVYEKGKWIVVSVNKIVV